jgi:uncharacterized protein (TIGR02996 family)
MTQDEAFLADIEANPSEPALRLIYADWLTEQGDPRGAYLRAEAELASASGNGTPRRKLQARLKKMRAGLNPDWLARIERTAIENCEPRFAFRCPKRWESLRLTGDNNVRFCEECQKPVFHCDTVAQAQELAWDGECVAIDSCATRREGDLHTGERMRVMGRLMLPQVEPPDHPPQRVAIRSGPLAGTKGELAGPAHGRRVAVRVKLGRRSVTLNLLRTTIQRL